MLSVKSNITTAMSLAFAIHNVIHDIMLSLCSFWNWPLAMFILSFHTWYFATPSYYHFWSRPNVCGFSSDIFSFSRSIRIWTFHFNHIFFSFFFALFRRRFSFHRFAISTIFRGIKKKEAHHQRGTCLSRFSVVNILTSKQEMKPTQGTKCTRDLVASMADSAQRTWSTPRPFWRGKRESIGLLVTARHENRLYKHISTFLGGQWIKTWSELNTVYWQQLKCQRQTCRVHDAKPGWLFKRLFLYIWHLCGGANVTLT